MTREKAKEFGLNILHGVLARNEKLDPSYASLVKEAIDALTEPSLPSNLEEAAEEFADREYMVGYVDRSALYKGFWHGAKWDREQLMKGAVEGKIIFLLNGDVAINIGDTDEYKLGKKVRVIVLPKEDDHE